MRPLLCSRSSFVMIGSFLLGCLVAVGAFSPLSFSRPHRQHALKRTQLRDTAGQECDALGAEDGRSSTKSATGENAWRVKGLASNGSAAANATTSRIADLARRGGSDVSSAFGEVSPRISEITVRGTSGAMSIVGNATSRLGALAEKGTSDVLSVANSTRSRLGALANRGTNDVVSIASTATSGLVGFAEKGTSDTKSVVGATASGARDIFEKSRNSAGEIVGWIDAQARDGASAANARVKAMVLSFTGKKDYRFGDLSKELLRRIASGDYNLQDTLLLLKVVLAVGASFGPLAKALPVTVLLEMLNISLEKEVGGKMLGVLAASLDERFTAAFTGDDRYQLGDLTKRSLAGAILAFTGKKSYESGDIERAVAGEETIKFDQADGSESATTVHKTFDLRVGPEFEEWDDAFRQSHPGIDLAISQSLNSRSGTESESELTPQELDMKMASELEAWDAMFREKYPDSENS